MVFNARKAYAFIDRPDGTREAVYPFKDIAWNTEHPKEPVPRFSTLFQKNLGIQLELLERLNANRQLGLRREEFAAAEAMMPPWPQADGLVAVSLVPYVENALVAMWSEIGRRHHPPTHSSPYGLPPHLRSLASRLFPVRESEPSTRLAWETIDAGCNIDREWRDFRASTDSPDLGVFAMAMHHSEWVKNMGREEIPNVCVPGMFSIISDPGPIAFIPAIEMVPQMRVPNLVLRRPEYRSRISAVPQFYRPA